MRVECKAFDLKDLNENQLSFIAESFFDEGFSDLDNGYMSLARDNFETALELYTQLGGSEFYKMRAGKCQTQLDTITMWENE